MPIIFILFVIIPLIEIVVLINVGQMIGAWYTIGLVLLSAFIGVNLLRHQGLSTLLRARERMNSGEIPAREMIEGIILAVGGALLITPGFVTDFLGFCCLIPVIRLAFVSKLRDRFTITGMQGQQFSAGATYKHDNPQGFEPGQQRGEQGFRSTRHVDLRRPSDSSPAGDVIDGECRREDGNK